MLRLQQNGPAMTMIRNGLVRSYSESTRSMSSVEIRQMYRHILKLAKDFPSVNRDGLIHDIKCEFHANKTLTDPKKIEAQLASARQGLNELSMYGKLDRKDSDWTVEIGRAN